MTLSKHVASRDVRTRGAHRSADDVYSATFKRMEERNRRFYERYPSDAPLVRSIVARLDAQPAALPRGGTLTARRFLSLGLLLGSASGMESLHHLLEDAWAPALPAGVGEEASEEAELSDGFLLAVEEAQQHFETNPIYWLLHEPIYCDGPGTSPGGWAAERVQRELGERWDYRAQVRSRDACMHAHACMQVT